MSVFNGKELLANYGHRKLAIPHFDIGGGNLDIAWSICQALCSAKSAAFLAGTPASVKSYLGYIQFVETVNSASRHFNVSVAIHLDHATEIADIRAALDAGFTSVMFDGSRLPFEENIKMTQMAVSLAREFDASTEGELGIIGGQEDEIRSDEARQPTVNACKRFVDETGVDIFAPAVGTCHGFYKSQPKVDMSLSINLADKLTVPLALHGATGLDPAILADLVRIGFRKVNFATGVRCAFRKGILETIDHDGEVTRPQTFLATGRDQVDMYVRKQLSVLMNA